MRWDGREFPADLVIAGIEIDDGIACRLGASLAHEINNPRQSVIGCLGLAEEMLDDGAEVRD